MAEPDAHPADPVERSPNQTAIAPIELTVVVPVYRERDNVPVLIERLRATLSGLGWEVVFVDDDSPDGTAEQVRALAQHDSRIRCLRRIGRRGLSSAVIEGALSSSAAYVAVIDGDLQHDETRLPHMLALLRAGDCDLAVASRYVGGGDTLGLASPFRHHLSRWGIGVAQRLLPVRLSDPMSGYFMLSRPLFEHLAPKLSGQGFKILLDLLFAAGPIRVREVAARFGPRLTGESKLDALVMAQFSGMLVDRLLRGVLPPRFVAFAAVGAIGLLVHLAVLILTRHALPLDFAQAQTAATIVAMGVNFMLNNSITYRDQRLRGARLWRGLALFMVVCGLGAFANIGIARTLYAGHAGWNPAGAAGAIVGLVWNYAMSATLVWRQR